MEFGIPINGSYGIRDKHGSAKIGLEQTEIESWVLPRFVSDASGDPQTSVPTVVSVR
jgi:hypothetical protein